MVNFYKKNICACITTAVLIIAIIVVFCFDMFILNGKVSKQQGFSSITNVNSEILNIKN